jgi:hypothetical protein
MEEDDGSSSLDARLALIADGCLCAALSHHTATTAGSYAGSRQPQQRTDVPQLPFRCQG